MASESKVVVNWS
jgi:hypothetical protein